MSRLLLCELCMENNCTKCSGSTEVNRSFATGFQQSHIFTHCLQSDISYVTIY